MPSQDNNFQALATDNQIQWNDVFARADTTYHQQDYQQCIQVLTPVIESTTSLDGEKWLAYYIRHLAHDFLFKSTTDKQQRLQYQILMIEDQLMRNYYSIFLPDYPEKVVFISASSEDNVPSVQPTKKPKLTKAQLKLKEKNKRIASLVSAADQSFQHGDAKNAVMGYQKAIDAGASDLETYVKCLSAHSTLAVEDNSNSESSQGTIKIKREKIGAVDISPFEAAGRRGTKCQQALQGKNKKVVTLEKKYSRHYQDVIDLCKVILEKFANEEASESRDEHLYFVHFQYAEAYLIEHQDLNHLELALEHYNAASQYAQPNSDEMLVIQRRQLFVAYGKMKHYARFISISSTEQKHEIQQLIVQHARYIFNDFSSFFESYPEDKIIPLEQVCDYLSYAEAAWFLGEYEKAEVWFQKIINMNNDVFALEAIHKLTDIYVSKGNYSKAIEKYDNVLSQQSLDTLIQCEEQFDEFSKLMYRKAICFEHAGELDQALVNFVQSSDLQTHICSDLAIIYLVDSKLVEPGIIESNVYKQIKSNYLKQHNEFSNEIDQFLTTVDEPVICSYMLSLKAVVHLKNKQLEKAIACFKDAAERFTLTPTANHFYENAKKLSALAKNSFLRAPVQKPENVVIDQSDAQLNSGIPMGPHH